jgi:hypothetical protein
VKGKSSIVVVVALLGAACGSGVREFLLGPSSVPAGGTAAVVVAASPSPTPPAPTPTPWAEVSTPPEGGEDIPANDAPVARVGARVYFVECGGVEVPGSEDAAEAPVGCRLHMDSTARDAANQPTRAQGEPRWSLSTPGLVAGGTLSDYTPVFTIRQAGVLTLNVEIDGVRSNDVVVSLK